MVGATPSYYKEKKTEKEREKKGKTREKKEAGKRKRVSQEIKEDAQGGGRKKTSYGNDVKQSGLFPFLLL